MSVLHRWDDLSCSPAANLDSDRIVVVVPESGWGHALQKHFLNKREPWKDVFGDELAGLREPSPAESVVNKVLAILREQMEQSLKRPFILAFEIKARQGRAMRRGQHRVVLVLPCGAQAVLGGRKGKYRWLTCYFPNAAVVEDNVAKRWIETARRLVSQYVAFGSFMPPDEKVVFSVRTEFGVEERWKVSFITPELWGFVDLNGKTIWRGRFPSWPEAEKLAHLGAVGGKRRLKRPRLALHADRVKG